VVKRSAQRRRAVAATVRYVESSAILAALLEGDTAAKSALRAGGRRVTSALTFAEVGRAIVRARLAGRLTLDQERAAVRAIHVLERRCDIVAVSDAVLLRVRRPFPLEPVGTMDGVHLSTLELLGEPPQLVTIVTRDRRIQDNARAQGYRVE